VFLVGSGFFGWAFALGKTLASPFASAANRSNFPLRF
jgi:hypothetical protein